MATNYGKDTSCTTSLRTGRYATGLRLVAEAAYRRLTTPRGMLHGGEEEADYGLDLTDLIGSSAPDVVAVSLPGRIASELAKDERIEGVDVDVAVQREGPATRFLITIEATTGEGPFTLQVVANEVTAELLGLTTEGG